MGWPGEASARATSRKRRPGSERTGASPVGTPGKHPRPRHAPYDRRTDATNGTKGIAASLGAIGCSWHCQEQEATSSQDAAPVKTGASPRPCHDRACFATQACGVLTEYVVTRWYRAPEADGHPVDTGRDRPETCVTVLLVGSPHKRAAVKGKRQSFGRFEGMEGASASLLETRALLLVANSYW